jgi:6-phospho 3-hexuloisomerase
MFQRQNQELITDKISEILTATDQSYDVKLTEMLDQAGRIFIAGAGRSKLVGNFFAMRLVHGGYDVSVVGEIVTPSLKQGDLLIVISGSGETGQLVAFTQKAKSLGAEIILISAKSSSSIGDLADAVFQIKSSSSIGDLADAVFQIGTAELYGKVKGMPMGTVFELSTLCFLEAIVAHMIWEKGIPEEVMQERHANLE